MANAVYPKALEGFLSGAINLPSDDIRIALVDSADYTYSATHQFVSDVGSTAIVARSGALTGKTVTGGAFDCDDPVVTGVTGDPVEIMVCYKHTGNDATARIISYHDRESDGTTALSLTPDGGNVNVAIPAGGLFAI
jgi:hypothetical protein